MNEIIPYLWIGIIVFAFTTEIYTFAKTAVWLIPSALAAFVMSLFEVPVRFQVLSFFVITLILLILSKAILKKIIKLKISGANENAVISKNAIVTEEINNYKNTGAVRVNGSIWNAKAEDDGIIYETGLVVAIIRIENAKAICSR